MEESGSPTVRRRELGGRLRALRHAAGLRVEDVAERLYVSSSKISRIETAARAISLRDVADLCGLYGVSSEERSRLMELARGSRRPSWWQQYDLPESLGTYVGLEAEAVAFHQYDTSVIPPLLQTEAYARAVIRRAAFRVSDDQVEQRVEVRLIRQRVLTGAEPPTLRTVIDEGALHRLVGGAASMRAQLLTLAERSELHSVTVQVIALEAGAHPGMDSTFTILDLPESAGADVVYVEGLLGSFYLQNPNDIQRYREAFEGLRELAMDPDDSLRRILSIAARLPR